MLMRMVFLVAVGATLVAPLSAQTERVRERRGGVPRSRVFINGEEVNPLDMVANRRARIGVILDTRAVDNDSIGATIESVTPGGPAAKANIRAGDIITRFNGQRLVSTAMERSERGEDDSMAALKLIELVAKLEPGDTVALEYRRGKDVRTTSVVANADRTFVLRDFGADGAMPFSLPRMSQDMERLPMRFDLKGGPGGPGQAFTMAFGGPFADLELAPLNPDLGAYFGTSQGVLVIDTPEKNALGLKGGDVILSVDGREARGPSSLLRILRSYEPGDVIKLEILRNKSRQTVSSKIDHDE